MTEVPHDQLLAAIDGKIAANPKAVFGTRDANLYLPQMMRLISDYGDGAAFSISRWQSNTQMFERGLHATVKMPLGMWGIEGATHVTSLLTSSDPQWKFNVITPDYLDRDPFYLIKSIDALPATNLSSSQFQSLIDLLATSRVISTSIPEDRRIWDTKVLERMRAVEAIRNPSTAHR